MKCEHEDFPELCELCEMARLEHRARLAEEQLAIAVDALEEIDANIEKEKPGYDNLNNNVDDAYFAGSDYGCWLQAEIARTALAKIRETK